ncbi:MAG TPA: hypothetical protein VFI84_01495 [Candidatus Saccharimonadales bacterium]|nr:hypothetical protein [Candidatus Saccharimonadales bacterium]
MSWKKTAQSVILSLVVTFGLPAVAFATCGAGQQSCSSSYSVGETFFGSGGNLNSCGSTYCSKQSAGETAVGNTKGTTYQAQAGFNTNRDPYIQLIVNTANIDLGYMQSGTTKTTSATFSVKSYLASGYVVQSNSPGPTTPGHTLSPMNTAAASNPTAEQFGINLVANNSCGGGMPGSLGASPIQVPSSAYSFGAAATGYNTACQFKYVNGDTIAQANSSSGETDYTISYIFNIAANTPSGLYTMAQTLVATSTY